MAFFQFRFPGKSSAAADNLAPVPGESLEVVRRRARHRLLGAVVLVFVAVVVFPLLFDSQPRPVAIDTPIVIPNRNDSVPLTSAVPVPAAQAPAEPLLPQASEVPVQSSLEPGKEEVVLAAGAASAEPPHQAQQVPLKAEKVDKEHVPANSLKTRVESTPKDKEFHAHSDKNASRKGPADDAQKARALLDAQPGTNAPQGKHIVQVGAFADAEKVREVRRKLEQAGLKTYTQTIEGKDGKRTTRVRLGPFESQAEAEKAATRVRKLGLSPNLVAL